MTGDGIGTTRDSGRILLVDDEAAVREVLSDYFVERGYAVSTAAGGQEALAAFARERPDIVLLDVRMPGMDGVQVLRRGVRLEDAALGAAREAMVGRHVQAAARLIEIKLLVPVASRLGDLPAAARAAIEAALETAQAALPPR